MAQHPVYHEIKGPVILIGFGSIGKGTLPLIERHFKYDKSKFIVIDPKDIDRKLVDERGYRFIKQAVTKTNYRKLLEPLINEGPGQAFIVNLSVDVASVDLMEFAQSKNAFYIDTVVEPWLGFYFDHTLTPDQRTNYAMRESMLRLKEKSKGKTTSVSCCGANPGMVSWFVKQALLDIARDLKLNFTEPKTQADWGRLMRDAGVKGLHIAERDTQVPFHPKPMDAFVNTWSVEGFISEGMQPAELGWGTHEMDAGERPPPQIRLRCGDLHAPARRQYARALLVPDAGRAIRLSGHPQRIDFDCRLFHPSRPFRQSNLPSDLALCPITPATTRSCPCTKCSAMPAKSRRNTASSAWMKSRKAASTSSACCSTAIRRTPTGTARSSRSTRPGTSRPTRTPPACR